MVNYCCAYGCNSSSDICKDIRFHRFPFSRPEILRKWTKAIRRKNFTPTKASKLCSNHFLAQDYSDDPGRLKLDAVPSVFNFSAVSSLQYSTKVLAPEPSPSPEPPSSQLSTGFTLLTQELNQSLQELPSNGYTNTVITSSEWNPLAGLDVNRDQVELCIEDSETGTPSRQYQIIKVIKTYEKGTQTCSDKCEGCCQKQLAIKRLRSQLFKKNTRIEALKDIIKGLKNELDRNQKHKIKVNGYNIELVDESII